MAIAIILAILLTTASVASGYYFLTSLLSFLPRQRVQSHEPTLTFAILIPAHNEEASLGETLSSLSQLDYPREMFRVYVVVDNCTDQTEDVAAREGVVTLVREDERNRGKGYAIGFGLTAVLADEPDAILMLDADCQLNRNALLALDEEFNRGSQVVQAEVRSHNADASTSGYVAAIGSEIDAIVASGLDRLGLSIPLRGTGMAFRRSILESISWSAFGAVEDAEFDAQLRLAGIRIHHCRDAIVTCGAPIELDELSRQRQRWRGALLVGFWNQVPLKLVQSKPLVLCIVGVSIVTAFVLGPHWSQIWSLVVAAATLSVYLIAIRKIGLSRKRVGLLLRSPLVVLHLVGLTLGGLINRAPAHWGHSARRPEKGFLNEVRTPTESNEAVASQSLRVSTPTETGWSANHIRRRP